MAFDRLQKIKNQSSVLVEEFTYNGLGHRIGWHYDVDADSDVDANDVWFHFAYDEAWGILGTFRSSDTNAKELFVAHMAGLNGRGGSSALDAVVLRDRDANTSWGSATDGTREERAYYCQNWRGDIVSMLKATGSTNCSVYETVRYSSYGVPFGITPGDVDGDGDCDNDDGDAILDLQLNGPYTLRADLDLDGSVDTDDVSICTANNGRTLGRGTLSHSTVANRRGYCGYEHDGVIDTLAHVRNRVLMTELGRWSRRDPLGYVDGMSAFQYVRSRPVSGNDPTGLATGATPVRHPSRNTRALAICDDVRPDDPLQICQGGPPPPTLCGCDCFPPIPPPYVCPILEDCETKGFITRQAGQNCTSPYPLKGCMAIKTSPTTAHCQPICLQCTMPNCPPSEPCVSFFASGPPGQCDSKCRCPRSTDQPCTDSVLIGCLFAECGG